MKFLPLVRRNLLRRKVRTIFTILSIVVAFLLFGVLMAIRAAFSMGVDIAGADRLMVIHRVSIIQPLPQSYGAEDPRHAEGVTDLTHANWFGGYYQDPKQLHREHGGRSGELARDVSRSSSCPRSRRRPGSPIAPARSSASTPREVRLEGRRPRPADLADLPQAGRLAVGLHHRGHLRLDEEGRRQDAVLLPLRLHERGAARGKVGSPTSSAGTSSRSRIRRPPISSPSASTRCSRTRPPRPRPTPRRRSSPSGRSRSATSARS